MSTATAEKLTPEIDKDEILDLHPRELRALARAGKWTGTTEGLAVGYAQANLVIIRKEAAFDFLLFCLRNPKPCPIVAVTDPGSPMITQVADNADLRTDLTRYSVYQEGKLVAQPSDITEYWRDDLVTFLFGCSGTFEGVLENAGIYPRWREQEGRGSGVYVTNIPTVPAGRLHGPMVVSMRPIPTHQLPKAIQATSRFPTHHGAPVHVGDPSAIGIDDLSQQEWVRGVLPLPGETPVFWACGVTPQVVAQASKPELMITHYPGHMFIGDIPSEHQAIL